MTVHASIWKFAGDSYDLLRRNDAMVAEIPSASMCLHLCLRAPDGIVMVDTCPTREAFDAYVAGESFRALRARHGAPDPLLIDDFPVHVVFVDGARV